MVYDRMSDEKNFHMEILVLEDLFFMLPAT